MQNESLWTLLNDACELLSGFADELGPTPTDKEVQAFLRRVNAVRGKL